MSTGTSRARLVVVLAMGLGLFAACGGSTASSSSSASGSTATSSATTASRDAELFCTTLLNLSGGSPGPAELDRMYSDLEANAPVELDASVASFVANARAVTGAFAAAGGRDASVDAASVLATLTPEQQQFVKDLATASKGGALPPGPTADVFDYATHVCGAAQSTELSSVGSAVN